MTKELPAWAIVGAKVLCDGDAPGVVRTITRVTKTSAFVKIREGYETRYVASGWNNMEHALEIYGTKGDSWRRNTLAIQLDSAAGRARVKKNEGLAERAKMLAAVNNLTYKLNKREDPTHEDFEEARKALDVYEAYLGKVKANAGNE